MVQVDETDLKQLLDTFKNVQNTLSVTMETIYNETTNNCYSLLCYPVPIQRLRSHSRDTVDAVCQVYGIIW